jgi:hypothetical protein
LASKVETSRASDLLSRRELMVNLGRYGSVGPAAVAILTAERSGLIGLDKPNDAVELAKSIGPKRLNATPSEIVAEFSTPRPGDLIPYYQLFWQMTRKRKLGELTSRADAALRSPEYARWPFRARSLPAMARIHALGISLPPAKHEHEEIIVSIHKSALDISQRSDFDPYIKPDREVLDAIWRTMTAALARNRNTWKSFAAGLGLIEQAVLLSRYYLEGDIVLFGPTIVAWQFLFSYEIATRSRPADHAMVTDALLRIENLARKRNNHWFRKMSNLYRSLRSLDEILPQQSEIFMGLKSNVPQHRQVEDYFVLVQMERFFINSQFSGEGPKSPYLQASYVDEVEKAAFPVLTAYGVNKDLWHRLRQRVSDDGPILSQGAREYCDAKFSSAELAFPTPEEREREELHAAELSKWIPFRNLDEERFSHRFWRSVDGAFAALATRPLEDFLNRLFVKEGAAFSRYLDLDIKPKDILEKVHRLIPQQKMQGCVDETRELIDRARSSLRPMQGWQQLPAEKPHRVTGSSNIRRGSSSAYFKLNTNQQRVRQHSLYERAPSLSDQERTMREPQTGDISNEIEVWSIANEIYEAIKILNQTQSPVTTWFWQAFAERSANPMLHESRPDRGLAMALSSVLIRVPGNAYLQKQLPKHMLDEHKADAPPLDNQRLHLMKDALEYLAREEGDVIASSYRIRLRLNLAFEDLLRAAFLEFADARTSVPSS